MKIIHSTNGCNYQLKKPIVRNKEQEIKNTPNKESLIDQFIENKPKIAPLEKGKIYTTVVDENRQDVALMTETLAKVYLEQKKVRKCNASL